ncbi:MAG: VOC family protein [Kineosporiaceae bacterium]
MADPLEALRAAGPTPAVPDPAFAARLRERLRRALDLADHLTDHQADDRADRQAAATEGDAVTDFTDTRPAAEAAPARPGYHSVNAYLTVSDGRGALDWYAAVLGARPRGEAVWMPDGRLGHAELIVGNSVLMLSEEFPEIGIRSPATLGGAGVSLLVYVDDVNATVERAVARGGRLERPVEESHGDRRGVLVDPFGHRWMVSAPLVPTELPPREPRHGDVGYITLEVPDGRRAEAFYGAVLGWRFAPGSVPEGRQVEGPQPSLGLAGGAERARGVLCYRVDDVAAAVARVRAAGGRADDPEPKPYGTLVSCEDDQGTPFQLWQP